jgi:hypothetical protein
VNRLARSGAADAKTAAASSASTAAAATRASTAAASFNSGSWMMTSHHTHLFQEPIFQGWLAAALQKMQVFKAERFAPGAANDEMQARVGVLRQMTQPVIDQLVANNAAYGIRTSYFGGALGVGMRTSSHIPPHTDILMGFGTFIPSAMHLETLSIAENYGNINAGGVDVDVIFDGRSIADGLIISQTAEAAALRGVNSALVNHSCRRNVAGYWVDEPTSGLSYMMFHTTRFIYPGEPLVSNYNVGVKPGDRFFKRYDDVVAAGTPPADIVRCACNSVAGSCPNDFAFDRRRVEPQLYPAA